ncbi:MAG: hypothetical protein EB078_00245 [Proteobacteria bacterium]|nr:hypothetical protein [Pseudomonadota bacterium]NDC22985.1 hypothetical protein [Pseudomonadota bacterium]NDD03310.1 hypothetical protein [Pseudomonadota bacterium]NDG25680.1 hypothetical protein [Pseudomonadota bacterium]
MLKKLFIALGLLGALASGFLVYQSASTFKQLSSAVPVSEHSSEEVKGEHASNSHEASGGHESGSHEAASSHESGGHESSAGHEASTAHEGGHQGRSPASMKGIVPFVSMDEVFANISDDKTNHTIAIKLDIEFFDDKAKQVFKTSQPGVKHMIIQTSREQNYDQLATLSGKLYFKELLIRKMNEYFQKPLVRDIHFASFFLQ